jgi:hypothetical protein
MRIPRPGDPRQTYDPIAVEDASRIAAEVGPALERATNVQWYEVAGNDADRAALLLCRLRRAMAGSGGAPVHGDEAVRRVLAHASPEAVVWLASRAVSYLDENGFPDAVAPWFRDDDVATD